MKDLSGSTLVFIGRSGCGKGTQVALLESFLKGAGHDVAKVTTGDLGREFAKQETPLGRFVKQLLDEGKLFPSWLAIFLNMRAIVDALTDQKRVLIIDGAPRRLFEAQAFDELMADIGRPLPTPIYLDISEDEARARLHKRGREDDKETHDIEMRLSWFKTDVMPVLEYYGARLITVKGDGPIEKVQKNLQETILKTNH